MHDVHVATDLHRAPPRCQKRYGGEFKFSETKGLEVEQIDSDWHGRSMGGKVTYARATSPPVGRFANR